MMKSKTYILADTGILSVFCRMSGGMSMPPVLAPSLITTARASPISSPPKSADRSRSSVSTKSPTAFCMRPSITGYENVLTSVDMANFLPRTR